MFLTNKKKIITKKIDFDYIKSVQSDPNQFFELSFLQMSMRVACKRLRKMAIYKMQKSGKKKKKQQFVMPN